MLEVHEWWHGVDSQWSHSQTIVDAHGYLRVQTPHQNQRTTCSAALPAHLYWCLLCAEGTQKWMVYRSPADHAVCPYSVCLSLCRQHIETAMEEASSEEKQQREALAERRKLARVEIKRLQEQEIVLLIARYSPFAQS